MQSGRASQPSAVFLLALPECGRLVSAVLTLDQPNDPGPRDDRRAQQILRCRELLFLNPEVLTAPLTDTMNKVAIVTSVSFLKSGKIQGFAQRVKAELQDVHRALPAEVQTCLTYTLVAKLAPGWNKVGNLLVQGREFMMKTCKQNAVGVEVVVTDTQVCIAVDVFTVCLPPPQLEDFEISTTAIQRFMASDDATISPHSIFSRWCHVLPSMKKGEIVSVTHALLPEGTFKTHNDLRKHWKNMHGYRLPPDEQEQTIYCHINFRLIGDRLFSYPLCCLRASPVWAAVRADHAGVLWAFMGDLRARLPAVCGFPLRVTPSPLYPTAELSSARPRETHSSQPVNLSHQRPSHSRTPSFFSSQVQRSSISFSANQSAFATASSDVGAPVSPFYGSQRGRGMAAARQNPRSADAGAKAAQLPPTPPPSSVSSSLSSLRQQPPNANDGWVTSLSQGSLGQPGTWHLGSEVVSATQPPRLLDKPRTLLGLPVFGAGAGQRVVPIFKSGLKMNRRLAGKSEPPEKMNFVQHVLSGKDSGGAGGSGGGGGGGGENGESRGRVDQPKLFIPTFFKVRKQPASSTVPTKPDKPTMPRGGTAPRANAVAATPTPILAGRPPPPSFTAINAAATPHGRAAGGPDTWHKLGSPPAGKASAGGATAQPAKLMKPKAAPADRCAAAAKRKPQMQGPDAGVKPKKARAKPAVQQVDVEEMAARDQLGKVNAVTLLSWLRGRGVVARSADRKEELVGKVLALVRGAGAGAGGGGGGGGGRGKLGSDCGDSVGKFSSEL